MPRRVFRTAEAALAELTNLQDGDSDDDENIYLNEQDDLVFEEAEIVVEEEYENIDPVDQTIDEVIRRALYFDDSKLVANSGMEWYKLKENEQTSFRNKINFKHYDGVTAYAASRIDKRSAFQAFNLIFSLQMMNTIVEHTKNEAANYRAVFKFDKYDLLRFIAILLCRGVFSQGRSVERMWSELYGTPIVSLLMSKKRFKEIMRFIRFDKKSDRAHKNDPFAMIREIWDAFIRNSQICYKPKQQLTIDEQLLPCKSRCKFIQFMPRKPDKFGIKFWLLVEVDNKYTCNGIPYLGKCDIRNPDVTVGESVVKKLLVPYEGNGHCVTMDNFFTSPEIATELLKIKTTCVGTVKKDKKHIPAFREICLKLKESRFYENKMGIVLQYFQAKPKKDLVLLSTQHEKIEIDNISNINKHYNQNKVGVDCVDMMTREYNVKAPSRRWPIHVFYNIINLTIINSWVIYKEVCDFEISREQFIIQLIEEIHDLVREQEKSKQSKDINKENEQPRNKRSRSLSENRSKCEIKLCNRNSASHQCSECQKKTCGSCTGEIKYTCFKCL